MKRDFRDELAEWPRNFITDDDLAAILHKTTDARHSLVKRAVKDGRLLRLRRGLYIIASHTKNALPHPFELSNQLYQPSMISLESALSYHGWIPEAVYTFTSVTPRRGREFETYLGTFSFQYVPAEHFYLGVVRRTSPTGISLIAEPWRALADFMYVWRRHWPSLKALEEDLRIDRETVLASDIHFLAQLCKEYPSPRVRQWLQRFLDEICQIRGEKI